MKLIEEKIWIDLEPFVDLDTLDSFHEKIAYSLAKNLKHTTTSFTTDKSVYNKLIPNFYEEREKAKLKVKDLNDKELEFYTKLIGTQNLGTHLSLRYNPGYPKKYYDDIHLNASTIDAPWINDFDFVIKWIDDQKCFKEYGRVKFWINEPNQKISLHIDGIPGVSTDKKAMFIWLTGKFPKNLVLYDDIKHQEHVIPNRAVLFNNLNWHRTNGHPEVSAWSLRIDGIFNKDWAKKVGVDRYFNL